jgi:hypothetical protein
MLEKILTSTSVLKNFELYIDKFKIIQDEIISLEIKYDFFQFGVTGVLNIKDSFDINNNKDITLDGKNIVKLEFVH